VYYLLKMQINCLRYLTSANFG